MSDPKPPRTRRHAPGQCSAMQDTVDALDEAAWGGLTMSELAAACGRRLENQEVATQRCHKHGLVTCRVELSQHLRKTRRWFLLKYAPRPDAYAITAPELVARHRTGPLADPWRIGAAPAQVVSARECRPWAVAAAQCIGGARG